jgi:hypothetical protein
MRFWVARSTIRRLRGADVANQRIGAYSAVRATTVALARPAIRPDRCVRGRGLDVAVPNPSRSHSHRLDGRAHVHPGPTSSASPPSPSGRRQRGLGTTATFRGCRSRTTRATTGLHDRRELGCRRAGRANGDARRRRRRRSDRPPRHGRRRRLLVSRATRPTARSSRAPYLQRRAATARDVRRIPTTEPTFTSPHRTGSCLSAAVVSVTVGPSTTPVVRGRPDQVRAKMPGRGP